MGRCLVGRQFQFCKIKIILEINFRAMRTERIVPRSQTVHVKATETGNCAMLNPS